MTVVVVYAVFEKGPYETSDLRFLGSSRAQAEAYVERQKGNEVFIKRWPLDTDGVRSYEGDK